MSDLNDSFLEENKCIFKKYKPIKKIGHGSFGNIYSAIRLKDKTVFAMKTEKKMPSNKILESESYYLYTLQGGLGIPKFITYGRTKKYNILIETLLDKSLFNIFIENKAKVNLNDICLIGMQILDRLQFIHSKDIIYRDIKPENFLIGINDPNVIYIVDFGLCKKYRSSKTGKHILPKLTGKFNGTLRYASPNVVRGKESSRRDDLISLGYMLIYLLKKDLPWQETFANLNKTKYFELIYLKDTNASGQLFKDIPIEFSEYIKYSRNLKFEQNPDYTYLRSLLGKVIYNNNFNYKKITFSWIKSNNKELLGMPRNNHKRKGSPQSRLLKYIIEERIKKLYRQAKSQEKILGNINAFDLHSNKIELSKVEQIFSDRVYLEYNNNIDNNIDIAKRNDSNNSDHLTIQGKPKKINKKIINKNKMRNFQNNIKALIINNNEESSISFNKSISLNKKVANTSVKQLFNNDKKKLAIVYNKKQINQIPIPIPKFKKRIQKNNNDIKHAYTSTQNNNNNKNLLNDRNYYMKNNISLDKRKKENKEINISNIIEYKSPFNNNINKVNLKMKNKTKNVPNSENVQTKKNCIMKNKTTKIIELNNLGKTYNISNLNDNKNNFNIVLINNNINYYKKRNNISPILNTMPYNRHINSISFNKGINCGNFIIN